MVNISYLIVLIIFLLFQLWLPSFDNWHHLLVSTDCLNFRRTYMC
uniref:Uncharacterized protein n=1 Tax=Arundo donax TaxID=35708 RepID=A0A0A9GWY4_ARUDO